MIDNSLFDPDLIRETKAAMKDGEPGVKLAYLLGIAGMRPLTGDEIGTGLRLIAEIRKAAR